MQRHTLAWLLTALMSVLISIPSSVAITTFQASIAGEKPFEQSFMITGYYSPLPGQCCYIRGGYEPDKILNGEGIAGSDGTPVYAGMAAAPGVYPFGTRIDIPGLGILEVNDRGGAIKVMEDGVHRLDIWMGHGEEGLARALFFGVWRGTATVYPNASSKPQIAMDLEKLPAPNIVLKPFMVQHLLAMELQKGDKGLSVRLLQRYLQDLGYFNRKASGFFGDETQVALQQFLHDYSLHEESADRVSQVTAATLMAAYQRKDIQVPIDAYVDDRSPAQIVAQAQRVLRFLGYYNGRTNQQYTTALRDAIVRFQIDKGVLTTAEDHGAGRIGPSTMKAVSLAWNAKIASRKTRHFIALYKIDKHMEQSDHRLAAFLEEGYAGKQVTILQTLLADTGFFDANSVNGYFGPATHDAVVQYQLDRGLILKEDGPFAGVVGPLTMQSLRTEKQMELYAKVRAMGWGALYSRK